MAPTRSNQLHDLRTVYVDFKVILDLIKSGYKFDDENGPALLVQLEKALGMLKSEITYLEKNSSDD